MSPIPPPEYKDKDRVKDAIKALMDEVSAKGSAVIDGVIVRPGDLAELESLVVSTDLSTPTGQAITKAWGEYVASGRASVPVVVGQPSRQQVTFMGKSVSGTSWDESHTQLERDLEDSLWALATYHTPIFTREMLYQHVGMGHMQDQWFVRKLFETEVHLLCPCKFILVLSRCMYEGHTGQCEEFAFPEEATLRRDTRCSRHKK